MCTWQKYVQAGWYSNSYYIKSGSGQSRICLPSKKNNNYGIIV